MKTVWIEVYKNTIEDHDEDDNLSEILVTEDFARKYVNECVVDDGFDDWFEDYTADNTMDFYQYAKEHDAIIEIRNC